MTKFTAGPWSFDQYGAIVDKNGETIRVRASVSIPMSMSVPIGDEARPNAHLIAAAPELYAALVKCLNFIENTESELGIQLTSGMEARAALAKARGEV